METEKLTKKRKKKLILAIVTLYLIVSAFLLGCRFARADTNITVSFGADPLTADVGETITFIWSITGDYQQAIIYFGDGNFDELTDDDGSIIYEYFAEGKYQVILMVVDSVGNINYYPTYITIENIAPQFDISLNVTNNKAWEDENVEISVINLVESEVDMADGVLTYIYDFADGNENQVSTNKSSIIHSWNNAGTYPITITVIDDQAALGQETIEITVVNRPPKAEFDIDVENDYGLSSLDYYASNNWRNDTLGNIPEGWDFHYLDEIIQMNSYQDIIYPSSTVKDRWFKTNILLDDHECIRELDDSCIFIPYWWSTFFGSEGAYDQFNMENLDIINGTVTKVEFVYTSELKNITYVDIDLTADLYVGESWIGSKPLSFSNTKQEYIIIWDELSISQDDLDDLQIKISCKYPGAILNLGVLLDMIDNYGTIDFLMQFYELAKIIFPNYLYYDIYLDSIYLNISYEAEYYTDVHPSTTNLKVVENNDEHNKVVQLQDNSKQNGVSLVKNFEDQNNGTVEFWIKNSEISSQTWSFSLWDDSFMASEIFIDESKWKVKIGSNLYDLESFGGSIGTPSNDWHHVTVDFCTSGAYNNLNQDQFQVTIDGIKSKIYAFDTDLSEINTIKIQSSKENIGTSWIDAIGYTWDPFYKTGDNEAPITTYPDKTTFLFSAADTEDTSSDIDSLRYFWEFGDGLRGYGKYVYHQYTKSGLYRIKLIVKDDNGDIDNFTRFLVVNN
ncbi:MAG: PKD domain-containing protein, partial [Promethearchaeota archaeon]